jgi:MSHA biogenesis protein MshQ
VSGAHGSTRDVVFKPHTLVLSGIRRTDTLIADPAAAGANGPIFLAAGAPFSATVTANDFEGTATPNVGRENPHQPVVLQPTLMAPIGLPGLQNPDVGTNGFQTYSNGSSTVSDLKWGEVGIIQLTPRVEDYLESGEVVGTQTANIGRFVPDDLLLELSAAPVFQSACTARQFTYIGERFTYFTPPTIQVTAVNAQNVITRNYQVTSSSSRMLR